MVVENQTGIELEFPCDWLWVLGCHQLQCIGCVGKTFKHLKYFETMFVHHQKSEFSVRVFLKSFSTKPSDLWDPMYFNPSWIPPFDRTSPNTLACGEASVRSCHNSPKTIRLSLSLSLYLSGHRRFLAKTQNSFCPETSMFTQSMAIYGLWPWNPFEMLKMYKTSV